MMIREFANSSGDQDSIPCRVIAKTPKWYLITLWLTLSIKMHGSWVEWSNPMKGVALFPTCWHSSY